MRVQQFAQFAIASLSVSALGFITSGCEVDCSEMTDKLAKCICESSQGGASLCTAFDGCYDQHVFPITGMTVCECKEGRAVDSGSGGEVSGSGGVGKGEGKVKWNTYTKDEHSVTYIKRKPGDCPGSGTSGATSGPGGVTGEILFDGDVVQKLDGRNGRPAFPPVTAAQTVGEDYYLAVGVDPFEQDWRTSLNGFMELDGVLHKPFRDKELELKLESTSGLDVFAIRFPDSEKMHYDEGQVRIDVDIISQLLDDAPQISSSYVATMFTNFGIDGFETTWPQFIQVDTTETFYRTLAGPLMSDSEIGANDGIMANHYDAPGGVFTIGELAIANRQFTAQNIDVVCEISDGTTLLFSQMVLAGFPVAANDSVEIPLNLPIAAGLVAGAQHRLVTRTYDAGTATEIGKSTVTIKWGSDDQVHGRLYAEEDVDHDVNGLINVALFGGPENAGALYFVPVGMSGVKFTGAPLPGGLTLPLILDSLASQSTAWPSINGILDYNVGFLDKYGSASMTLHENALIASAAGGPLNLTYAGVALNPVTGGYSFVSNNQFWKNQ